MLRKNLFVIFYVLWSIVLFSQNKQIVKGTVRDKISEEVLIGANILLVGSNPPLGTVTNEKGCFSFEVPLGRQTFIISYTGYKVQTIPEIVVTIGKQTELEIKLEENINVIKEVVVTNTNKDNPNNEFSSVSARTFSMEEVTRYSGGRNDVARLVSNFAGVGTANDARNDIVVRGNSPSGILWRLEGVPIPSPNHFSTLGTTGGPISALNTNLLKNSDFITGAFAPEYGNANSGVFDLGFRSGNNSKHEMMFQLAAFSGLELMAEGPMNKKQDASYLISYRYSFAGILASLGAPIGTKAAPWYQDLSFKFDLPNTKKAGKFSVFGIGGYSYIDFIGSRLAKDDLFADPYLDRHPKSIFGVLGIKHHIAAGKNAYVKTVLSGSTSISIVDQFEYPDSVTKTQTVRVRDNIHALRLQSYYNKKFSSKLNMRAGVLSEVFIISSSKLARPDFVNWVDVRSFKDVTSLLQAYAQWQYKPIEEITINGGLHTQYLFLNNSWSIEPRASLTYQPHPIHKITFAYGRHSQMQPFPVYFYRQPLGGGTYDESNRQLDFTRAHHIVLAYDVSFAKNWRLKFEPYVQFISGVPVERYVSSSFSILNAGADFIFPEKGNLKNKGVGRNMGIELTIEKFFSNGFYGLFTASIFDSKYKGSDGVWRNTAFNNLYVINFLAGYEFKYGRTKKQSFTIDARFSTSGGRRYTPIDVEASKMLNEEVLIENQAYSKQYKYYLRLDLKIGLVFNEKRGRFTQTFFVDFQNVTWAKNVYETRFNIRNGELYNVYQMSFLPDVLWRLQFGIPSGKKLEKKL